MKNSTKAAVGAGAVTAAVGIGLAFLCPLAGMIGGGYLAYGALATAGFSTAATVALTIGGGLVGLIVGRIAKPLVALAAVGIGAAAGGVIKLFGSLFEKSSSPSGAQPAPARGPAGPGSSFRSTKLSGAFRAGYPSSNENDGQQQRQKPPAFKL